MILFSEVFLKLLFLTVMQNSEKISALSPSSSADGGDMIKNVSLPLEDIVRALISPAWILKADHRLWHDCQSRIAPCACDEIWKYWRCPGMNLDTWDLARMTVPKDILYLRREGSPSPHASCRPLGQPPPSPSPRDLSNNRLAEIAPGAFSALEEILEIDISGNQLKVLLPTTFRNLRYMTILKIHRNQLIALDENVFRDLVELRTLDASQNQFVRLPRKLFHTLRKLVHLDVSFNMLQSTEFLENIEEYLPNLEYLSLKGNSIFTLDALASAKRLQHLSVAENQLENIDELAKLPNLKKLNGQRNRIKSIPSQLSRSLEELDLSRNEIERLFPNNITDLEVLKWLDLSYNYIEGFSPEAFTILIQIKEVRLQCNSFTDEELQEIHELVEKLASNTTLVI